MGFFEDLGSAFGVGPGNQSQRWGKEHMDAAGENLRGIANTSEAQSVANAGAAGQALGESRGRTDATQGTRAALQAARTSGLNKGQAALTSGQQAGDLYTKGFESGQDKGIDAYGNATNQRIGASLGQIQAGQGLAGQGGQQAGQLGGTIGGIAKGIGGMFAEGGIVDEPTPAVLGEDGKEAVIPLEKPDRAAEVLKPIIPPDHLDTVIALAQRVKDLEAKLAEPKNA